MQGTKYEPLACFRQGEHAGGDCGGNKEICIYIFFFFLRQTALSEKRKVCCRSVIIIVRAQKPKASEVTPLCEVGGAFRPVIDRRFFVRILACSFRKRFPIGEEKKIKLRTKEKEISEDRSDRLRKRRYGRFGAHAGLLRNVWNIMLQGVFNKSSLSSSFRFF